MMLRNLFPSRRNLASGNPDFDSPLSAAIRKFGVDARCLNSGRIRGIGKYLAEMLGAMPQNCSASWILYGDRPERELVFSSESLQYEKRVFDFKGYKYNSWMQLGMPIRAMRDGLDLLFCTANDVPLIKSAPIVCTLHDMMSWTIDRGTSRYINDLLPLALRSVDRIITPSQCSANDIANQWSFLQDKISVIPHGIDSRFLSPIYTRPDEGSRSYIMYLGGAIQRKRFEWALNVFAGVDDPEIELLCCGFGEHEIHDVRAKIPASIQDRVRILPFVSDEDLRSLYQGALAVLYPTLYEGFGFPALESQACGTPILLSPLGSLVELKGPFTYFLPQSDLSAWVDCLRQIIASKADKEQAARVGAKWASSFSWSISAARHLELFDMVASGK